MNISNKFSPRIISKFIKFTNYINYIKSFIDNIKHKLLISLFLICIFFYFVGSQLSSLGQSFNNNETIIHYINVGQGDSILIQNKDFNILIDSGSNTSSEFLISYLNSLHIKKLNYIIATHPHEDHIGAMDDIINKFHVYKFIGPKLTTTGSDFKNMIEALNKKNLYISTVTDNSTIKLSNNSSLYFPWTGSTIDDNTNNYSMVVQYNYNDISFLFTGDIEKEVETKLLSSSIDLSSEVLKVSHHGSNSSSTLNFLNEVNPFISIISCGMGNDYGHPHKNTLTTLKNFNSSIYRTDLNGTIKIKTDGTSIWVNTEYNY